MNQRNDAIVKARSELSKLSKEAKAQIKVIAKLGGNIITVNQMLIRKYSLKAGSGEWKTFDDWRKAGFRLKTGETPYRVWAAPVKSSGNVKRVFYPMRSIFNSNQVCPVALNDEC